MVTNNSLDSLATNGIIDFDANAFVKGTPPRFFGSPNNQYGGQAYGVTPGSKLNGEPEQDAFVKREKGHTPPNWLSMLTASIVAALGVFGVVKVKSALDGRKAKGNPEAAEPTEPAVTSTEKKGIFDKIKDGISSLIKPKEGTNITEKAGKVTEKLKFWAKHPKLKIAGVGALGLLGLYGLYGVIKPKHQTSHE